MYRPFCLSSTWNILLILRLAKPTDQTQQDHAHRIF